MTKEYLEEILTEYGVAFTDSLADRLLKEFEPCDELDFVQPHKKMPVTIDLTPCDDAVSRQVVKRQMLKYGFHAPDMTVSEFVEDLPPVNPTKTGHWIDRSEGGRIKYPWMESNECSKCGENGSAAWNYCPNCGAKMIDPQESEDKK